jgi:hypothetical protein
MRRHLAVDRRQQKRERLVGLLEPLDHPVRPPRLLRVGAAEGVQLGLLGDERAPEEPVHLVPRGTHLRGDGVAEHGADRVEQVVSDDRVLAGLDAERHVLVGDPAHHRGEVGGIGVDEVHGERHHRRSERLRLLPHRLVGAVEHPQQLGVGGEHRRVEDLGDLLGVRGDDTRGGSDDGF